MYLKNQPDIPQLIECLEVKYAIAVTSITNLALGADREASKYRAETRDGASYFLKLRQGHSSDLSVTLTQWLKASGIQQIISPTLNIDGDPIQPIHGSTLTVYPFVEGKNGFTCPLNGEQWISLGQALRHIHQLQIPPTIQAHIRRETYSAKWRQLVRELEAHINESPAPDEAARKLQVFMRQHGADIRRLVDRAESLSLVSQKQSYVPVLCHSDIHGGNVLIDDSGAIYIVDWDEPIIAPKERDLMFIGGGVANVWNRSDEEEAFYKGYGETAINRAILSYYRHERIVQDIGEYGQALLLTSEGGDGRLEMLMHFMAMFEPNGVVEIAFRTDDSDY